MKRILVIIGIVLIIGSLLSLLQYIPNVATLSEYEQGIAMGKAIFLILGLVLTYIGHRK